MKNVNIPNYITNQKTCNFPERLVLETVNNCDKNTTITIERDTKLELYQKSSLYSTDIVFVTNSPQGEDYVSCAIRLISSIFKDAKNKSALTNIMSFVDTFGLEIEIGDQKKKFYFNEQVVVRSKDPQKAFSIINPQKHSFFTSFFFKVSDDLVAEIRMAFCIDSTNYISYLEDT